MSKYFISVIILILLPHIAKEIYMKTNNKAVKMYNEYIKKLHSGIYDDPLGIISEKEYQIEQQKYLNKFMQRYKK